MNASNEKLSESIEKVFGVLSLVLYSGGFLVLLLSGGISQGDGREMPQSMPVLQVVFGIVYLITFCLTLKHWKTVIRMLFYEKFILLLMCVVFISIFWSGAPWITLRRSVALGGTTLFGIYFALRYDAEERLSILGWAMGLIIVSSLIFVFFSPKFGIMGGSLHAGSWRGIYSHKNSLGRVMVLGVFILLFLSDNTTRRRCWAYAGFFLTLILLIFSTSKTMLLISSLILCLLGLYWGRKKYYKRVVVSFGSAALLGGYLFLHIFFHIYAPAQAAAIISSLTKKTPVSMKSAPVPPPGVTNSSQPEPSKAIQAIPAAVTLKKLKTLTGRTQLWAVVWEMIQQHPWLGYGYGAFWLGLDGPSAYVWKTIRTWKPPSAHNGIMDLWLETGLGGVFIFLIGFAMILKKTIPAALVNGPVTDFFPFVFLLSFVLVNLLESSLVHRNSIYWVLYTSVVFSQTKEELFHSGPGAELEQ